jgi:putative redox protein
MKTEKVNFPGALGEQLAARLDLPDGKPKAYALFAHCFTCSKDIFAATRIASGLADEGIAVLRFDFTGLGHSDGEFANTSFSSNISDLLKAADYLREAHQAPKLVIGHSLGGAAVLAAAGQVPEALAVATIGAPAEPAHVQHLFRQARPEIEAAGEAEVLLAGRPFRIKKQFLEDIEARKLESDIAAMKKALIVFHAPRDDTVGIENAGRIFAAAKHPKSFISLDDADHLLTRKSDSTYVARVLAAWATRSLEAAPPRNTALQSETGSVVPRETREGRFTIEIAAGRHPLRADEPESYGGLDSGPSPYDLVVAGLGACTAMTLRMYAERKGWPLQRVTVDLKHDKIHAEDCETCETKEGRVDRIQRRIAIEGSLDREQRSKLLAIADRCPVHRTLEGEVLVTTELV